MIPRKMGPFRDWGKNEDFETTSPYAAEWARATDPPAEETTPKNPLLR
jgi:hypothetical protein